MYREAMRLRRQLQGSEELTWLDGSGTTIHLSRPGGWHSVTNFGRDPFPMPPGELLIASRPLGRDGLLPGETTGLGARPTAPHGDARRRTGFEGFGGDPCQRRTASLVYAYASLR